MSCQITYSIKNIRKRDFSFLISSVRRLWFLFAFASCSLLGIRWKWYDFGWRRGPFFARRYHRPTSKDSAHGAKIILNKSSRTEGARSVRDNDPERKVLGLIQPKRDQQLVAFLGSTLSGSYYNMIQHPYYRMRLLCLMEHRGGGKSRIRLCLVGWVCKFRADPLKKRARFAPCRWTLLFPAPFF